jgi:DNA polymerase-4
VSIKIRYDDFETVSRARTLEEAADDDQAIAQTVLELWREHAQLGRPVRLLGVTLSQFTSTTQLSWLAGAEREERKQLNQALDRLRERHGLWVVSRGTHLSRQRQR